MGEYDDGVFRRIADSFDERPSLEEVQISRKQRYFQRLREKPKLVERKKRKLWVQTSDDEDDEMPVPVEKPVKKPRKRTTKPKKPEIIEITLDSDVEIITSIPSSSPPSILQKSPNVVVTSSTSSSEAYQAPDDVTCEYFATSQAQSLQKSPNIVVTSSISSEAYGIVDGVICDYSATSSAPTPSEEDYQDLLVTENTSEKRGKRGGASSDQHVEKETEKGSEKIPSPALLRGRLPPCYQFKKSLEQDEKSKNAEKKEARLKIDENLEKLKTAEEKLELRRKRDRERKRLKTMEKNAENGQLDKEKIVENNKKLDQKLKKKEEKRNKITDPSLNPSEISLGAPEKVPWAPKPKRKKMEKIIEISPPTTSSSPEDVRIQMTSIEDLMENVDFDDVIQSPTNTLPSLTDDQYHPQSLLDMDDLQNILFEEDPNGELIRISEEELSPIENIEIDDNFLLMMNDDTIHDITYKGFI